MRPSAALLLLAVISLSALPVAAAQWQPVASANGERVDIDKSRIQRTAQGHTTAWTRLLFGREMTDGSGSYTAVQAMNRYDCEARRFVTVKRVFLGGSSGDRVVREENVASPREMPAEPGSVDDRLLTEACRLRTVGEAHRVAEAAAQLATEARSGVMRADMRTDGQAAAVRSVPVADNGKTEPKPAAAERPRFIALPTIDKSQVEDPYKGAPPKAGENKPADAKAPEAKGSPALAAAKPAERPAPLSPPAPVASRQELERQYATSGPRRAAPAARRKAEEPAPPAVQEHRHVQWSYEGEGAPANWAKLRPDYGLCATGRRQSPIDIREGIRVDLEPIKFDYRPSQFRIVDNGHTIQVNVGEGSSMSVMGRNYQLLQFHFHRPAEERVNGKSFDMVIHFVHKDEEGRLAEIAVLLEKGAEHPIVQTLWNNMPLEVNQDVAPAEAIDLNALLPENRNYYTYMGSLTTPPCTEDVLWMVFKQPLQVSAEQVAIFSRLYRNNARPIQPANNRLVKENR